ncbi:MAG: biopolymer transporter ExbD [Rikenellaceae bacterium]
MAIKRGSKVETASSSASMTDLMFLLLIFFMVATTLINQNALNIQLPQSSNVVNDKPSTTLSVTENLDYFIDNKPVRYSEIESILREKFKGIQKPILMISIDKRVQVQELTKFMNMAKENKFDLFMMTSPN